MPRSESVLFASSFRLDGSRGAEESPNLSHSVVDGADRTLCGRRGWVVNDGEQTTEPDCLRCAAALVRLGIALGDESEGGA